MQDKATRPARNMRLNDADNIIVAVDGLMPGAEALGVTVQDRVPKGHKMAARKIEKGEPILKFGQIIGFAGEDIEPGRHIHTHNCLYAEFDRDYAFAEGARNEEILPVEQRATFEGYQAGERQGWYAQLCGDPDVGELFGVGCQVHGGRGQPVGHSG